MSPTDPGAFGRHPGTFHADGRPTVLAIVFNMFFPFVEVANAGTAMWKLWRAGFEK